MNSQKYLDYEDRLRIKSLQKMTGGQSLLLGFGMFRAAFKLYVAGVKARRPGIRKTALKKEICEALWRTP